MNLTHMKRGQGLLETIVAIGVIVTGLISVMTLVISNLTSAREAAMRYQAVNLAREGIELIRNARDSNWLSDAQNVWSVDPATTLEINRTLPVPFSRTVQVNGLDDSRTVVSTVEWQSGSSERKIELNETLYDWR